MFNFYPTCNIMCTKVSSSMILTRKTKLVLFVFKQAHFPLQSSVFQWISHFVLQIASLHFHTVTPSFKFVGTHLYLGGERHCEIKVTCPRTQGNAAPPEPLHPACSHPALIDATIINQTNAQTVVSKFVT